MKRQFVKEQVYTVGPCVISVSMQKNPKHEPLHGRTWGDFAVLFWLISFLSFCTLPLFCKQKEIYFERQ